MQEDIFPFFEPFFGVGEKVGNEGKRGNHDEDNDKSLAGSQDDECSDDGDDAGEDDRDKHPEGGAYSADDGETSYSGASANGDSAKYGAGNFTDGITDSFAGGGNFVDIGKDGAKSATEDIANVDG